MVAPDYTEIVKQIATQNQISSAFTTLIIIVSLNILVSIVSTVIQYFLNKNGERKIHSFKVKENRRVDVLVSLYEKMEAISNIDSRIDREKLLSEIGEVTKYVSANRIFISKKVVILINEYSDYMKGVYFNYRSKDISKEMKYFDKFRKIFNS